MSYTAPYIDASGLVIPSYIDIRDYLIESFKSIYGQDCYLESDSADYQWISIVALRIHDCLNSIQLIYNNRGPETAIGSGLDQVIKLNGIRRQGASYSTCELVITGVAGTVITDGEVTDASGYRWSLPSTVTIPSGGEVSVTATCQTIGAISALIGDITTIATPTAGWTGVDNESASTVGLPVETDAEVKIRQALSVTMPSMNLLTGTVAAIAALENVTRYNVIENNTNEYDADGNPPHSITCIVEGGSDDDIANVIWLNRGIGPYINGDVEVPITDPITGIVTPIRFYRPDYVPIYVTAYIEGYSSKGYTSATTLAIQQALTAYLNGLQIGADVTISALYAAAMEVAEDIYDPLFSIALMTASVVASPQTGTDIIMGFNEVAQGTLGNVEIAVELV